MSAFDQRYELEKIMGKGALDRLPRGIEDMGQSLKNPKVLENPRICKSFIVGKCPYDIFAGTKEYMGRCPKTHQVKYRMLYEDAKKRGVKMPRHDYELDYLRDLDYFINECDKKIKLAQQRLDLGDEEKEQLADLTGKIDHLSEEIGLCSNEVQLLAKQGDLERSLQVSKQLESMATARRRLADEYTTMVESINQSARQKLQVCTTCGGYLSTIDEDRRLVDHFVGKIHLSYVEIRNIANDIRNRLA